jgi:cellobiose phosphorylase
MRVRITNISDKALRVTPTAAIPIYGRSADNLRDHRHVTSLLHRIRTIPAGVVVQPTLSFDERGHRPNQVAYCVVGAEGKGALPVGFFPLVEDFIGEGGTLDWPEAVVRNLRARSKAGACFAGYEAVGALRFRSVTLRPGQSRSYVIALAIREDGADAETLAETYCSDARFDALLETTRAHWQAQVGRLAFRTGERDFDLWMRWVTVQPILRRIYGCSFLPHHDYGRGGRGWRDLWQDCLALLVMDSLEVRSLLLDNYAGVRMDGTNATIIGSRPGEFIADRNRISRVWMDHGAWPFLTTRLYIDQSGDLEFLLQEQVYFKDGQVDRAAGWDAQWQPGQGTRLMTTDGECYTGTVLEHILVQHLTAFFNVGEHNAIRLENADWNDGMDMAPHKGESVALTALYASNLRDLANLLLALRERRGVCEVALATKLLPLLDRLGADSPQSAQSAQRDDKDVGDLGVLCGEMPVDYDSVEAKRARLQAYFDSCRHTISGEKVPVSVTALAQDLAAKADWLCEHVRKNEWITSAEGYAWFNGYYDDDGVRVEGDHPSGVRMSLTGQVFTLMGGIATDEQARQIVRAAERYLKDPAVGGYRLNTDFGGVQLALGRCFGFAYGHKENGAMFSHMAVMVANALYKRGLVREGWDVLAGIYRHCADFEKSRIYPGIPEYINARGRGMYHYLTGSASWLLLTMLTEAFGVKGVLGDLALEPKLLAEQFDAQGQASVTTVFAGRKLEVVVVNPKRLDYGAYTVQAVRLDGQEIAFERAGNGVLVAREAIAALDESAQHRVEMVLG